MEDLNKADINKSLIVNAQNRTHCSGFNLHRSIVNYHNIKASISSSAAWRRSGLGGLAVIRGVPNL